VGDAITEMYENIDFQIEFETQSKYNWKINKLNLPANFREEVMSAFDEERQWLTKIMNLNKLNNKDRELLKAWTESAGLSEYTADELFQEFKKLNKKEKKELIKIYNETLKKEYIPLIAEIENANLVQVKNDLNSLIDISIKNHYVILQATLDSGVLIKNTISYPEILIGFTKNKMIAEMVMTNGFAFYFDSECNSNNKTKNNSNETNENFNSTESKLKKLKSLFEQNLITQDEYDAKRKEILDAM
jgi:hypothetical protein